jgi:hypothetical protein
MRYSKNRIVCPVIELFGEFCCATHHPWVTGDREIEDFLNRVLKFKTRGRCKRFWGFQRNEAQGVVQMGSGEVVLIKRATREREYTEHILENDAKKATHKHEYTEYILENEAVIKTRQVILDDTVEFTLHLYLPGEEAPACWWSVDKNGSETKKGHVPFQKKFDGGNADYFPQ